MHIIISERMDDMKKLGKFLLGSLTVATAATGLYYLYKNFINKDYTDDFDDFDDDFDLDSDMDESPDLADTNMSNDHNPEREYVSININDSKKTEDDPKEELEEKEDSETEAMLEEESEFKEDDTKED